MNEVLSKKKSEIVLAKFAQQWSRSTYFRYETACFDPDNPEAEEEKNPNYEILDFFRREFSLKTIEELFTEEYYQYRLNSIERLVRELEEALSYTLIKYNKGEDHEKN